METNFKKAVVSTVLIGIVLVAIKMQYTPHKEEVAIPCPYRLAQDDTYKVVMTDCDTWQLSDGSNLPGTYIAHGIEIQKLDGTLVQSYENSFKFDIGEEDARIYHDINNSYVFLVKSTWVVGSINIFSLKEGKMFGIDSYVDGLLTKNGYLVYVSADGLKHAHPQADQDNATNIIAVNLADFNSKVLFSGDSQYDYGIHKNIDTYIDIQMNNDNQILIDKYLWTKDGRQTFSNAISIPINQLEK
jgi:hypothetical protein